MLLSLLLSSGFDQVLVGAFFFCYTSSMNWKPILRRFYSYLKYLVHQFLKDSCTLRATSLAYSTLLALVPLTATVFSISTAFGAFTAVEEQLKDFLITQLIPGRQDEIIVAIEQFVKNASTLGIVGFFIFSVTSVSLLNGININFNAIWGSSSRKGFISSFTTYTSIIVFGTIFIGASFTLTSAVTQFLSGVPEIFLLTRVGLRIAPSLFVFLLFMLMISAIPTGPVKTRSAALGALVGAVLWEGAKLLVIRGTNYVIRASIIYGSLAIIPIFLFWIYIMWLIIFISLEIAYVHQHCSSDRSDFPQPLSNPSLSASLSLTIYLMCAEDFRRGKGGTDADSLAMKLSLDQNAFVALIKPLMNSSLLHFLKKDTHILLPGKDLSTVSMEKVLRTVFGYFQGEEDAYKLHPLIQEFYKEGSIHLENVTVYDYLVSQQNREEKAHEEI